MNVVRVLVGNEVVLRGDLPLEELEQYPRPRARCHRAAGRHRRALARLARAPGAGASTSTSSACTCCPTGRACRSTTAVDYSFAQFKRLQKAFPHKPIVVAEIGWPSRGRTHESAVASESNEALFLRRFLDARRSKEQLIYYVMEAFDQPWKAYHGGRRRLLLGRVRRQPPARSSSSPRRSCASRSGTSSRRSRWRWRSLVLGILYLNSDALRNRGRSFLALVVYAAATIAVWVIYDFTQQYMTVSSVIAGVLLLLGMLGVLLVLLAEAHEWAEAHWVHYRRRLGAPMLSPNGDARPRCRSTCRPTTSRRTC